MRLLLVTNRENHHKYWASQLASQYEVVGVCHPNSKPNRNILYKNLKQNGFILSILKLLSVFYQRFSKNSFKKQLSLLQNKIFGFAVVDYEKLPKSLIYHVESINSEYSIQKAKELHPDLICFLGGDIAKREFLSVAKMGTLNFHSGVSPFYNGSGTTYAALADNRPNFCGGTLMIMNERIDGGRIIAHYLTPINLKDNSAEIFLNGIKGAVVLYSHVIDYIVKNNSFPIGVIQERSIKYQKASDWTIYQDLKLRNFFKSGMIKNYVREAKSVYYLEGGETQQQWNYINILKVILSKNK